MRRFIIYHRRESARWRPLRPGIDARACKRTAVRAAIRYMRDNPAVGGIVLRLDGDDFLLIAAEPGDCYEFTFPED